MKPNELRQALKTLRSKAKRHTHRLLTRRAVNRHSTETCYLDGEPINVLVGYVTWPNKWTKATPNGIYSIAIATYSQTEDKIEAKAALIPGDSPVWDAVASLIVKEHKREWALLRDFVGSHPGNW